MVTRSQVPADGSALLAGELGDHGQRVRTDTASKESELVPLLLPRPVHGVSSELESSDLGRRGLASRGVDRRTGPRDGHGGAPCFPDAPVYRSESRGSFFIIVFLALSECSLSPLEAPRGGKRFWLEFSSLHLPLTFMGIHSGYKLR